MSDLISRKSVLDIINRHRCDTARIEEGVINLPTAYDVDEVVERLEELPHGEYKDDFGKGYAIAVKACTGIVKGAVKE